MTPHPDLHHSPVLRLLALGAGVQSTAVLLLACHGVIPRFDHALFADTGWEPQPVYDHVNRLRDYAERYEIPVLTVSNGDIRRDALDPRYRFATMPLHVISPGGRKGMAHRHQRIQDPPAESQSTPTPRLPPPAPRARGSFRRTSHRHQHPSKWADAVAFDHDIRHGYARALITGTPLRGRYYLHRAGLPLDLVDLSPPTLRDHLRIIERDEESDPDGCSPWSCRSGTPIDQQHAA